MLRPFAWGSSEHYSLLRKVKHRGTTQIVTVVMLEFRGTVWKYSVRVHVVVMFQCDEFLHIT